MAYGHWQFHEVFNFHVLVLWPQKIQEDRVTLGCATGSPWSDKVLMCALGWDLGICNFSEASQVID